MADMATAHVLTGDCLKLLPDIPTASIDSIVTDPPYPEIDRAYGRLTEAEWWDLMRGVVAESRRVLKPSGSAVFILQPNSERVGRMRPWLFEFQAWICRTWGMVQDAWWWNHAAMPSSGATNSGLMRGSLKACVWAGDSNCYRNQRAVLWGESERNVMRRNEKRVPGREFYPSGHSVNRNRISEAALERGGVTPFNVLPIANTDSSGSAGASGHGAGTPLSLCRFWVRYLTPPEGSVLDPFCGSGTVGQACLDEGFSFIGIEKMGDYAEIARTRIANRNNLFGAFTAE